MVRRLRQNVKGKPPKLASVRYSMQRKILLTGSVLAMLFAIDVIDATRRAQLVSALLNHAAAPHEVIVATGAYVTNVDAPPECQVPSMNAKCRELLLHVRGLLGTTYSFRVRYLPPRPRPIIEKRGPWWFKQPFDS